MTRTALYELRPSARLPAKYARPKLSVIIVNSQLLSFSKPKPNLNKTYIFTENIHEK